MSTRSVAILWAMRFVTMPRLASTAQGEGAMPWIGSSAKPCSMRNRSWTLTNPYTRRFGSVIASGLRDCFERPESVLGAKGRGRLFRGLCRTSNS